MPKKRLHVYDDKSSVRRAQGAIVRPCVGQSSDLSAGHRETLFRQSIATYVQVLPIRSLRCITSSKLGHLHLVRRDSPCGMSTRVHQNCGVWQDGSMDSNEEKRAWQQDTCKHCMGTCSSNCGHTWPTALQCT